MAPKKRKKKTPPKAARHKRFEVSGLILMALGVFMFVSLFTESIGVVGHGIKQVLFGVFGVAAYALPILITALGVVVIVAGYEAIKWFPVTVWTVFAVLALALLHMYYLPRLDSKSFLSFVVTSFDLARTKSATGGALGSMVAYPLHYLFGFPGAIIFLIAFLLAIVLIMTRLSLRRLGENVRDNVRDTVAVMAERQEQRQEQRHEQRQERAQAQARRGQRLYVDSLATGGKSAGTTADVDLLNASMFQPMPEAVGEQTRGIPRVMEEPQPLSGSFQQASLFEHDEPEPEPQAEEPDHGHDRNAAAHAPGKPAEKAAAPVPVVPAIATAEAEPPPYVIPPVNLLTKSPRTTDNSAEEINRGAALLEETLMSFGVSSKVINVCRGPAITRYELQPAAGVKISRIVNLSNDIALNMAAQGVRIEAPIPGKAAIGIEVPNAVISMVKLRDVLESPEFQKAEAPMSFCLGKDIAGKNIVADVAKMPHMMIAGSTGSGKSVCINSLIVSILYKASPEQVRMIMIDPKIVELKVYNGIPHLLIPVVSDPKKAAGALNWAVQEMVRRYELLADKGARDIHRYNQIVEGEEDGERLPQIMIVVDELADLMMVAPNEVEDSICRLAQMARAAGMHLVIATQRPSVDVITGVIKANIPSRIAFAVSSQVDSRTILDMAGAEKLLGRGDMLFDPSGASKPLRVQGAYVSENEVEKVVEFIKQQYKAAEYDTEVLSNVNSFELPTKKGRGGGGFSSSEEGGDDEYSERQYDALLMDAMNVVYDTGQASISMVQRKLKVGYARAARLVDELEELGVVSPSTGSKPRDILKTRADAAATIEQYRG